MSTTPTPEQAVPVVPVPPPGDREIRIYSHSSLFYWWPVWAVGFLLAAMTFLDGNRMAIVPNGSKPIRGAEVRYKGADGNQASQAPRDVLVLPENAHLAPTKPEQPGGELPPPVAPYLHMARSKNFGVLYATVLLFVIVVSNVSLRGLWSVAIILVVVIVILVLALFDKLAYILDRLYYLDVRINLGGYLFISLVLFIIWALTVFVFDRRTYVVVTPGQVRVCMAVGAGETVYDTTGMTFTKHQNDLFRHWIIGLGAGDLVIHRSNTNQEIDMPNVLFIGAKVREIEQLVKERQVV